MKNEKIDMYIKMLSEEYSSILRQTLLEISPDLESPNINELLEIDLKAKSMLKAQNRKNLSRVRLYNLLGTVYIFLGMFMYLFAQLLFFETSSRLLMRFQTISLMVVFLGIMIIVFGNFFIKRDRFSKTKEKNYSEYDLLHSWTELEVLVNDRLSDKDERLFSRTLVSFLHEKSYINNKEADFLNKCANSRNKIVHESNFKLSQNELRVYIEGLQDIIKKLK